MLSEIKIVGEQLGITTVITTSQENIDAQLNRIVREEDLPVMLISWDIKVNLEFDSEGVLQNPTTPLTILMVDKAEDGTKILKEEKADEVGILFIKFIRTLKTYMHKNTNVKENPITSISFQYIPSYGAGKYSGVMGFFTTQLGLTNECI
jgi:hypothetical protein